MTWKLCESLLVAIIFSYVDYCGAIIGGSHIGQERFFVSIEGPLQVCGGTIIDPDIVLTAAECLYDMPPVSVLPWVAVNRLIRASQLKIWKQLPGTTSDWEQLVCEAYEIHPRYSEFRQQDLPSFNIAVVKLQQPVDFGCILPYCPAIGPYIENYPEGYAIGIGWTQRRTGGGEYQNVLKGVTLEADTDCERFASGAQFPGEFFGLCYGTHVMADFRVANTLPGIYVGDIGGPLIHRDTLNPQAECLIGIASFFLTSRDDSKVTSVFTGISDDQNFISQAINHLSSRSTCQTMK